MISNQPLILNSLDADFSVAPWSFFDLPLLITIFVLATIESPAPKNLREQNYFKNFSKYTRPRIIKKIIYD